jgi:Methyltransferase domain
MDGEISPIPLDLERRTYSYAERPNRALLRLLRKHLLDANPEAHLLDIGAGCGANARAIKAMAPRARLTAIEPDPRAAELAGEVCDAVFCGDVASWIATSPRERFDGVILSDVLEHLASPIAFLRALAGLPGTAAAVWAVSVPNFAVWYNRLGVLIGRFDYSWSGLYDRTHLRFFTRRSIRELLLYCGYEVLDDACSPSLAQSLAPWIRRSFEQEIQAGKHLVLSESRAYLFYERVFEPVETSVCRLWPELLGFQVVTLARLRGGALSSGA